MPSRSTFLLVLIVHAVIIGAWFATAGGMFSDETAQTPPSDPWQAHWVDLDDSVPAQVAQLNARQPVLALKGKSKPVAAPTVVKPAADLPPAPPVPVDPPAVVVNDPPSTPRVAKALPADSSSKSKSNEKSGDSPSSKTASAKAPTPVVKERTPAKTETSKPATTARAAEEKKASTTKPEATKTPPARLPKHAETATRNERDPEPRPDRSPPRSDDSRDFSAYRSAIRASFHENWEQPRGLFVSPDQPVVTQVRATIARDGTVLKRRITDPSGMAEMDDSVEAAIKSVRRIAPLPKEMSGDTYEVDITFRLR